MAKFEKKLLKSGDINGGYQFNNGDGVQANAINAPIEAILYLQDEYSSLKEKVSNLEGGIGTGTIYFYDSVVAEILNFSGGDIYYEYSIEVDGEDIILNEEFFANKCTHVNFGGTGDESGAYLFFYEKSVKLSFYEAFPVYVNGEDIAYAYGEPDYVTFVAPQVLHVTIHD